MRTKTLLLAAAALATGLLSSQAQGVYSGIVGYETINLTNGFNLINNSLDYDGTGTNNTLQTFFGTNLPVGSIAYTYQGSTFPAANWISTKSGKAWSGNTNVLNAALNKGGAVFLSVPTATNITVVGNVTQGTNIITLSPGFNMISAVAPIAGDLQTNLNYVPSIGDIVYVWNPATQLYSGYNYISSKSGAKWNPSSPQISVGQGVFIYTTSTPAWTNIFVAQ